MPVSRQMPSRFGPIHCGQSSATATAATTNNAASEAGTVRRMNHSSGCRGAGGPATIFRLGGDGGERALRLLHAAAGVGRLTAAGLFLQFVDLLRRLGLGQ